VARPIRWAQTEAAARRLITLPNVQLFQPAKRVSDSSLGWSEAEPQEYQPSTGPARDAGGRAMLCRPFHGLAGVGVGHPGVPLLLHPRLRSDADSVG
jgi:hypothetical protein